MRTSNLLRLELFAAESSDMDMSASMGVPQTPRFRDDDTLRSGVDMSGASEASNKSSSSDCSCVGGWTSHDRSEARLLGWGFKALTAEVMRFDNGTMLP